LSKKYAFTPHLNPQRLPKNSWAGYDIRPFFIVFEDAIILLEICYSAEAMYLGPLNAPM
jgi:hypothetical protein